MVLVAIASVVLGLGCSRSERPDQAVRAYLDPSAQPAQSVDAVLVERDGPGRIRYLGFTAEPETPTPGAALLLRHVLEVEAPFASQPKVFVHIESGGRRVAVADHSPIGGQVSLSAMKTGERWVDEHRVSLPANLPAGTLDVFFGLFREDLRMTVEAEAGGNDGRDRLRAGRLAVVGGAQAEVPVAQVRRLRPGETIAIDGHFGEAAWSRAQVLTMSDSLGRDRPVRFPTKLRLLFDNDHLYVAFEAEDADISDRYSKRDDPIYEHEAVELFVMPNVQVPATGPYIEMQASPRGVIFDASFTGPRQGMNTKFNAGQRVANQLDGTINDNRPDRRWRSEWAVPFASIPGAGAPKPGDEWRMNAFRIEKFTAGSGVQGEYTAWSPPKVGDFHAVHRFGRMRFVDQ